MALDCSWPNLSLSLIVGKPIPYMKIKLYSGGRGKGGDAECFPVKLLCPDITISKIIFVAQPLPPPTLPAAVHPTICCLVKIKMASAGGGVRVSVCPCVHVSVRSH